MNIQGFSPLMAAPLQAQATSSNAASATGTSSSSTDPASGSDLQSTFLSLLVTELQNQDPTQPVDPTQMVSEMISLNQLDQLININQTLSALTGTANTSSGSTASQAGSAPTTVGGGSNASATLQGAFTGLNPLTAPATPKNLHGANGSLLHQTPTASPAAINQKLPAYPGPGSTGALNPAAWMNLYGNLGAPANATNQFTATGGR